MTSDPTNLQLAKDAADLIQSGLVSIAVLVGAVWTLFTFRILQVKKKAAAELEELQHRLSFKPLINISVDASSHPAVDRDGFLILAAVTIENVGDRDTTLYFPENRRPFITRRVSVDEAGNIELGQVHESGVPFGDTSDNFSRGAVVRAGAKVNLPFVTQVNEAGLYLASFSMYPTIEDREIAIDAGAPIATRILWTGRAYVIVRGH